MQVAFASSLTLVSSSMGQVDLGVAGDDVWAFNRAADPGGDPVLRVWGNTGEDLNPTGYPGNRGIGRSFYSYAFLQWDLSGLPEGYRWRGATLTLTVEEGSYYDPVSDDVFVRGLTSDFDESTWEFGLGTKPIYGDRSLLVADDRGYAGGGSTITVDIPAELPDALLQRWRADRKIFLAVTSPIDNHKEGKILRIASAENPTYEGPRLVLH